MDTRKQANEYLKVIAAGIIPNGKLEDYRQLFADIRSGATSLTKNLFTDVITAHGVTPMNYLLHARLHETDTHFPVRIDICDRKILGEGGFGKIFRVIGKIKLNLDLEIKYKPINNTVLKIKRKNETYQEMEQENTILKRLPHLNMTAHTIILGTETPILRMRYLSGRNLAALIDNGTVANLKTTEKLIWAVGILRALHEQFHRNGIIHRDISPSNILIEASDTSRPIINIIDTDACVFMTTDDKNHMGTYEYRAPEGFTTHRRQTIQSDHYSVMVCIIELLSGARPKPEPEPDCKQSLRHRTSIGHVLACEKCNSKDRINQIFSTIKEGLAKNLASCDEKTELVFYFMFLLTLPETERPTLSNSIVNFEELLLRHQLKYINTNDQDKFKMAFEAGRAARIQLEKVGEPSELIHAILKELELVDDQSLFIYEFTQSLSITLLHWSFRTKEEIRQFLLNELVFYKMTQDFSYENNIPLSAQSKKYLAKIERRLDHYHQLADSTHWTLDLLHELNQKNRMTFEKLIACTPSVRYKLYLDSRFHGRQWLPMNTPEIRQQILDWLVTENKDPETEHIKVFLLHYQLLHALYQLEVHDKIIRQAAEIQAGNLNDFTDALRRFKTSVPHLAVESSMKLFPTVPVSSYQKVIDAIIDRANTCITLKNSAAFHPALK